MVRRLVKQRECWECTAGLQFIHLVLNTEDATEIKVVLYVSN